MCVLQCKAHVQKVIRDAEIYKVVVDQTTFYPQGGGQPADRGTIKNDQALFVVQGVSLENCIAYHKGIFEYGSFALNTTVDVLVDPEIRVLHNKNHTAGHIIDYALAELGYSLIPGKGYHFPQGPYVEYGGTLEQAEREQLIPALEKAANEIVARALPVTISLIDNDQNKRAMSVTGYLPILCGGTHVANTNEIGDITIRKIKNEKGNLCAHKQYH
jgi:alanyl-tRNA synthetase